MYIAKYNSNTQKNAKKKNIGNCRGNLSYISISVLTVTLCPLSILSMWPEMYKWLCRLCPSILSYLG